MNEPKKKIIEDTDGDLWKEAGDGSWISPTALADGVPAFAPDLDVMAELYGPLTLYREVN